MSNLNDEIDEIISQHIPMILSQPELHRNTLKAMLKVYEIGKTDGIQLSGEQVNSRIMRFLKLVKAQKELIVSLGKLSLDEHLTSKEWDRMDELRNQIKQLES